MADYYTKFSVDLPLPDAAAQSYALDLAAQANRIQYDDEKPDRFPVSLIGVLDGWHFETAFDNSEPLAVWLNSQSGGVDAACKFIQHLLQKFDPKGRVTMEWSFDCSKPRTDASGGGAAIITARRIKSMNTTEWLDKNTADRAHKPRQNKNQTK